MLLQSQTLHSAGLVANNNDDENDNDSSPTVRGESARVATISHTRTVVRECCKGDDASQWRNPNFDPPPRPNPFFFGFLQLVTAKAAGRILTQNTPKHAVPRKDVPFRGREHKI